MIRALVTVVLVGGLAQRGLAQPEPAVPQPEPAVPQPEPAAPQPEPAAPPPSAEDLEKAADAAAAAASVPAPPHPAETAGADDIDLRSLGLDPTSAFDDKLNIYGFADIMYSHQHWVREIPGVPRDTPAFGVGNLNVYFAKNLTAKARMLAEVRFTFMPNGSMNADGTYVSTDAQDLANFMRVAQWGGIVIERVYLDYDITEHVTIRVGRWLTPYGIWNIDHGSPAILATNRPYIIGEQFFPEHQTGLDLLGSHYLGEYKLTGHLTVSNGRGATDAVTDQDNKLAFGGRVELEAPWGLKVGGSYYRGRYSGLPAAAGALAETFREAAYGGDVQLKRGPLHLQSEVIARERHYIAGQRPATAAGFAADGRDFGLYGLAAYRLDQLWGVTPFAYFEIYQPRGNPLYSGLKLGTVGLNLRPTPTVVLKLQANNTRFDEGPRFLGGNQVIYVAAQVSWVF